MKLLCQFESRVVKGLGDNMKKSFEVFGKVQGIMFRQTFIRGALKRKITGGVTNDSANHHMVHINSERDLV